MNGPDLGLLMLVRYREMERGEGSETCTCDREKLEKDTGEKWRKRNEAATELSLHS